MKIIGITGKSGAGKSTLADFLGERKNVGVIHIDKVLDDIKEKKFKKQIRERNHRNEPILLTSNMRMFLNSNRITFKIFMFIKKKMLKSKIDEKIQEFKVDGKDAVVIESVHLREMVDSKLFDSVIYVRRPYAERVRALQKRDNISKRNLIERDLPYKRKFSTTRERDFDYIVDNNCGMEDLRTASKRIYNEVVGIKTFDERYKIPDTQLPAIKDILKVVRKTKKINGSQRENIRE